jgi:hypothetical protein
MENDFFCPLCDKGTRLIVQCHNCGYPYEYCDSCDWIEGHDCKGKKGEWKMEMDFRMVNPETGKKSRFQSFRGAEKRAVYDAPYAYIEHRNGIKWVWFSPLKDFCTIEEIERYEKRRAGK